MANTARGERTIEINGKKYTLNPKFEALAQLSELVGCTEFELLAKFGKRKHTSLDVAAVLWVSAWGHNPKLDYQEFMAELQAHGIGHCTSAALDVLYEALTGRNIAKDQEVATEKKPTGSPAPQAARTSRKR